MRQGRSTRLSVESGIHQRKSVPDKNTSAAGISPKRKGRPRAIVSIESRIPPKKIRTRPKTPLPPEFLRNGRDAPRDCIERKRNSAKENPRPSPNAPAAGISSKRKRHFRAIVSIESRIPPRKIRARPKFPSRRNFSEAEGVPRAIVGRKWNPPRKIRARPKTPLPPGFLRSGRDAPRDCR